MQTRLHKKSILKKTAQVGISLLFSKFLGIARDVLQVKYLGVGPFSDAFNIAFRIPNALRKVFAEGALSAALIPTLVKIMKGDHEEAVSKLLTLTFIAIGAAILVLCLAVVAFPHVIVWLFAPGFMHKEVEFSTTVHLIRILIFFIFFIFSSALLAGAMQAKHHFTIPSWGPALLNVVYIGGLLLALGYDLSVERFAYFILLGGLLQLVVYLIVYFRLNFRFLWPDKDTWGSFKEVMKKFLPCIASVSAIEINLLIDARFASMLPPGSATLLILASRFMTIALGAFAVAFSSILLPHFSRITTYAPRRLSFYLLESAKFILWVIAPVMLLMSFFAHDIFYTIFYKLTDNFSLEQVTEAATVLIIFLTGLFFSSLNKLILSIYYSLHETFLPTVITFIGALSNFLLNRLFVPHVGIFGIATATSLSTLIQLLLLVLVLYKKFNFVLYLQDFFSFAVRYMVQLGITSGLFYLLYKVFVLVIQQLLPQYAEFLLHTIGLWFWVGPLSLFFFGTLYLLRKRFNVIVHFLG
jgi:putative peptidoglycan lipid II flippase